MSRSYVATGNIAPSRAVKLSTTLPGKVTEADADEKCVGISGETVRRAPATGIDDGYHAIAGENCLVYTVGDECLAEVGGTVTIDDRLVPDADGKLITSTTDNEWIIAHALQSGVSGQLLKVVVVEAQRY